MRIGRNPFKEDQTGKLVHIPQKITLCMMTFIPNSTGYFKDRFEILKLSLGSLIKNTDGPFDILICDNGSHDEVINYLIDLKNSGQINYLILNSKNLGYNGALNLIFSAAPGEIIGYSDDDVFFHKGWLNAALEIIETYPNVGYVTGGTAKHQFGRNSNSTLDFFKNNKDIITHESQWKKEWDQIYAASIGQVPDSYIENNKDIEIPLYEYNGIFSFPLSTHFQYLTKKSVIEQLLPFNTGMAMSSSFKDNSFSMEEVLDVALDNLGYLKLTTNGMFTEHMGNVLSERSNTLYELIELNSNRSKNEDYLSISWPSLVLIKLMNIKPFGTLIYKAYDFLFTLIVKKQIKDKKNSWKRKSN